MKLDKLHFRLSEVIICCEIAPSNMTNSIIHFIFADSFWRIFKSVQFFSLRSILDPVKENFTERP